MHELSIALSLLDLVEAESARRGGARVAAIHLQVGALSGVVRQSLESAYELARAGTALEHAALVVEEVPVTVYCSRCAADRPASVPLLCCATCQAPASRIVRGNELQLVALEIES